MLGRGSIAGCRGEQRLEGGRVVAATWEKQDLPLRRHAQAVARSLTR
ncbi:hypothetical protein [Streptomyces sp. NPDC002215]